MLHLGVSSFSILLNSCGCNAPSYFYYYLPRIQMTVLSKFDDVTICIYSLVYPTCCTFLFVFFNNSVRNLCLVRLFFKHVYTSNKMTLCLFDDHKLLLNNISDMRMEEIRFWNNLWTLERVFI